jgi:hypothetical protein
VKIKKWFWFYTFKLTMLWIFETEASERRWLLRGSIMIVGPFLAFRRIYSNQVVIKLDEED